MHARAVEDAGARLRDLRHEEREQLGVAGLALAAAVVATQLAPSLALPVFLGGIAVGIVGVRTLWRRWDLVDQLAGERDAYVLPEVLEQASREATMDRRQTFAAAIRATLAEPGSNLAPRVAAASEELEALVAELSDPDLDLDPACAVACARLLSDVAGSPLLSSARPEELRSRVRQIRSGFRRRADSGGNEVAGSEPLDTSARATA